jgi:hypothetical protein
MVRVPILVLAIGLFPRVFDYDYDDEGDDDNRSAPSPRLGTLAVLTELSLMQPCGRPPPETFTGQPGRLVLQSIRQTVEPGGRSYEQVS